MSLGHPASNPDPGLWDRDGMGYKYCGTGMGWDHHYGGTGMGWDHHYDGTGMGWDDKFMGCGMGWDDEFRDGMGSGLLDFSWDDDGIPKISKVGKMKFFFLVTEKPLPFLHTPFKTNLPPMKISYIPHKNPVFLHPTRKTHCNTG